MCERESLFDCCLEVGELFFFSFLEVEVSVVGLVFHLFLRKRLELGG